MNALLISIDTLRADHLGCYGYERPTSPALDRLCQDSVVFEQAIAQAPSTLHSHASIFTSLLPHHHGATWAGRTRLADECTTVTEVFQSGGYATGAFTGGGQMDRIFGLDQGFDFYEQPGAKDFQEIVTPATAWLGRPRENPFFLFLHTYETHHPYTPAPGYLELFEKSYDGDLPDEITVDLLKEINRKERELADGDLEHIIDTYDAEIRSMDAALERLIAYLEDNDLYDDTMIVFTSDHGEEFGEHGKVGWHSHSLFDELLRVPLVVKFPGQRHAGIRVESQVSSIDIAPTLLKALGLEVPSQFDGRDLTGIADGSDAGKRVAISRMDRQVGRDIDSVRTPDWKLYRNQLFDLDADPEELWDTALNRPRVIEMLRGELVEAVDSREPCLGPQVVPTGATLDELKALGYLQ
ncbi:MAG: sulfatase [Thermoanaerobaculia bacterium]